LNFCWIYWYFRTQMRIDCENKWQSLRHWSFNNENDDNDIRDKVNTKKNDKKGRGELSTLEVVTTVTKTTKTMLTITTKTKTKKMTLRQTMRIDYQHWIKLSVPERCWWLDCTFLDWPQSSWTSNRFSAWNRCE